MNNFKKIVVFGVTAIFFLTGATAYAAFTQSQIDAVISLLQAFGAETSIISDVRASLSGRTTTTQPNTFCYDWNINLRVGDSNNDVVSLKNALRREGIDDVEKNSSYDEEIDEKTASAIVAFQEKYRSEILTPNGLAHGTGYVGPATRRALNRRYGCSIVHSGVPVITGIDAPTTLSVGQIGTWTIKAYDRENGSLSYSVRWGDEPQLSSQAEGSAEQTRPFVQTATFTHSYATAGTYTAMFFVKDSTGKSASMSVTVRVGSDDQRSITVISPNGGETWPIDSKQQVRLNFTGSIPTGAVVAFSLVGGNFGAAEFYEAAYSGNSYEITIPSSVTVGGDVVWPVTLGSYNLKATLKDRFSPRCSYPLPCPAGSVYPKVLAQDSSDAPFTITSATQPSITVLSPNGGESWAANSVRAITWNYANATLDSKVDLYLEFTCQPVELCEPTLPAILDKNINANGSYNWIVATDIVNNPISQGAYRMKICVAGTSNCDTGNAPFTITAN